MNREGHTILATKLLIHLTVTRPRQSTAVAPTGSLAFSLCNIRPGYTCLFKAWLRATSIMVFVAVYEDDQDCTYCLRSLKEVFKFLANDISETWELQ